MTVLGNPQDLAGKFSRHVGCRCCGQHSHENEATTLIRREPFMRAVFVLNKTCLYKCYSSRLI